MSSRFSIYADLTKPGIMFMVLVTAATGFFLGGHGIKSFPLLAITILGTALCCGGAAVLNNYLEREVDSRMRRTRERALPSGRISPAQALGFGVLLVLLGVILLAWKVNLLTAFLALLSAFLYVLVYTPLKRITWLNTFVGAIPGALPPVGGWTAATGHLEAGAWVLFAILFLWQLPHFYSIAWICREDYRLGGFKMLPVVKPDGASTFNQIIVSSVVLIPISLMPTLLGLAGYIYFFGTLILGIGLLVCGMLLWHTRSITHAKKLLHASIVYLPLWFVLIISDVGFK